MATAIVCGEKLNSIDEIHEWLNECSKVYANNDTGNNISINFSKLRYVSTLGSITLLSTLIELDSYFYLDVVIPTEENVIGYLQRMDFFTLCPDDVRLDFEKQTNMDFFYNRKRRDLHSVLLEIKESIQDKDIVWLHKHVQKLMKDKGLSPNRVSDIACITSELGHNAIEHGKSRCWACVQYYQNKHIVEIAICDIGMGIYQNLKNILPHDTQLKVIQKAFLTKISRLVEQGRGKGLLEVKDRTFNWAKDAKFYLRTHDSAYQIFDDKLHLLTSGEYFVGSYYQVIINTR